MLHGSFLIEVSYQFSISISNLTYLNEDKIQENPLVLLELRRFRFVITNELNLDGVPLNQMHDLQAGSNEIALPHYCNQRQSSYVVLVLEFIIYYWFNKCRISKSKSSNRNYQEKAYQFNLEQQLT